MNELNVIFGLITITSFVYAIWVNRELERTETIKKHIIARIREVATKITEISPDTNIVGYADSIISFCNSITLKKRSKGIQIGRYKTYYYPFEIPPMRTRCGIPKEDEEAKLKFALSAKMKNGDGRALFGPYKTLPFKGKFRVNFSIKIQSIKKGISIEESDNVLALDVFDFHGGEVFLKQKKVSFSELDWSYSRLYLDFEYFDIKQILEYRVGILIPDIEISIDHISIQNLQFE